MIAVMMKVPIKPPVKLLKPPKTTHVLRAEDIADEKDEGWIKDM